MVYAISQQDNSIEFLTLIFNIFNCSSSTN